VGRALPDRRVGHGGFATPCIATRCVWGRREQTFEGVHDHGWCTAGCDTVAPQEAKTLLEELASENGGSHERRSDTTPNTVPVTSLVPPRARSLPLDATPRTAFRNLCDTCTCGVLTLCGIV